MPRRTVKNRNIEVILLQDDKHLGEKYEIVGVKPIFARNVLLPQNIAVIADKANKNKYEQKMQAAVAARAKKAAGLEDLFAKMAENGGVKLVRKANKDRVLYAKVGEVDIVAAIKEKYGIEIEPHYLKLKKKLNEVGTFVVPFLYKELKKEVMVVIESEAEEEKKAEEKIEETVVEKTKEELKAEREAKKAAEKAEKIAKLKEKYK
ncbi:MAG: 50S ribosomal protein L9 [candidate division SR1 bacterium]|nr:MAG: 50S ribosomal protein L9 [candidate division SR1 bacterium]